MSATASTTTFVENLAEVLTSYAVDTLEALEWTPGRVIHVAPGAQVAWDDCCDGQLWVRLAGLSPAPKPQAQTNCVVPFYFAEVELGLLRCASVVDEDGTPPTPTQLEMEGLAGLSDLGAMLQAIQCNPNTREVRRYTPQGPQGGCVGGVWTFQVRLHNCIGCPAPSGA